MNFNELSPGLILGMVVSIALLPYMAVMVTSFTKLVVVFSLLRNALGLQQTPPNMVTNGLALILSVFVMYPVGLEMSELAEQALKGKPALKEVSQFVDIGNSIKEPMVRFMEKHSTQAERDFFYRMARDMLPEGKREKITPKDIIVLTPAFTVHELTEAFRIGFMIYLPFLVIDLIVSNVLLAMGMMMLSPTTVSLPFKLLLFILLDGWSKLIHALISSYA